jgi:hypothetical protein
MPPALPSGRYTVIWHNLSDDDGDEAQGAFHFYVGEGPGETPEPTANFGSGDVIVTTPGPGDPTAEPLGEPDSDDNGNGVPAWLLVLGIAGGLVAGGGAGLALGRRRA